MLYRHWYKDCNTIYNIQLNTQEKEHKAYNN
jgi:hypothetical protein